MGACAVPKQEIIINCKSSYFICHQVSGDFCRGGLKVQGPWFLN